MFYSKKRSSSAAAIKTPSFKMQAEESREMHLNLKYTFFFFSIFLSIINYNLVHFRV